MSEQQARVRAATFSGAGQTRQLGTSEMGGVHTDRLLPEFTEMCRTGRVQGAVNTVATGVVPLQVVPTTTAAFVIQNVDSGSGAKNIIPLMCGAYLASGTAGIGVTLFAGVSAGPLATALAADTAGVTRMQGIGAGQSQISWVGLSKSVVANWIPLASANVSAAAVPGTGVQADCRGMFIVRPTWAFMLHTLADAGSTSKFSFWVTWLEVPVSISI